MKHIVLTLILAQVCLMCNAQYKVDKLDGKCYMAGASIVENSNDDNIFGNIVLWAQKTTDKPGLGFFSKLDYASRHLELETVVKTKTGSYSGMLKGDVYGGIIKFRVEDIVQQSPKLTPLEKLQPEKKQAHKTAITNFEQQESELIEAMLDFAKTNDLPLITHWQDIEKGRIVKGMNETECLLAVGKSRIVNDSNGEVQWQDNLGMYIFFKNGEVSSVVK